MKQALYWSNMNDGRIRCDLCPHACILRDGGTGVCRVRRASGGELVAASYGRVSSVAIDPIEKKPLYHFFPGSDILSIGGWGCNLACKFCQNWAISQESRGESREFAPGDIVEIAKRRGSFAIAYTYNEPLVGFEFMLDCAKEAGKQGVLNVLVTNGYIQPAPADELLPLVSALNIDIKSMADDFYRRQCGGSLDPVLSFCVQAVHCGCHVEITNLVIPGLNDSDDMFRVLATWIRDNLGKDTPLHLSAYYPQFRMAIPPTSGKTLEHALEICGSILSYVYAGNVRLDGGRNTECRSCGRVLVERNGYHVRAEGLKAGLCAGCGAKTPIITGDPRAA